MFGGPAVPLRQYQIASSAIASLAYDSDAGEAVFTFHRGRQEYRMPISRQQTAAWANSASPGEYFNENLKGVYG